MPTEQLLTKLLFWQTIPEFGIGESIKSVKFNLPRGKVARILGFNVAWIINSVDQLEGHFLEVNTAPLRATPPKPSPTALWTHSTAGAKLSESHTLPKPYRCTKLTVYAWAIDTNQSSASLIIYYDTDTMSKDEDIHLLESMKQRSHRTIG